MQNLMHAGVGTSPSSQWDFWGSTLVTSQYVRLTPDERSKQGSIWNTVVSKTSQMQLQETARQTNLAMKCAFSLCSHAI